MLNLFIVTAYAGNIEKLEILSMRDGIYSYIVSKLHEGTWDEEEGAAILFEALLPIKEPAMLWASKAIDKTQLKGIVADLNGMGCNITLAIE